MSNFFQIFFGKKFTIEKHSINLQHTSKFSFEYLRHIAKKIKYFFVQYLLGKKIFEGILQNHQFDEENYLIARPEKQEWFVLLPKELIQNIKRNTDANSLRQLSSIAGEQITHIQYIKQNIEQNIEPKLISQLFQNDTEWKVPSKAFPYVETIFNFYKNNPPAENLTKKLIATLYYDYKQKKLFILFQQPISIDNKIFDHDSPFEINNETLAELLQDESNIIFITKLLEYYIDYIADPQSSYKNTGISRYMKRFIGVFWSQNLSTLVEKCKTYSDNAANNPEHHKISQAIYNTLKRYCQMGDLYFRLHDPYNRYSIFTIEDFEKDKLLKDKNITLTEKQKKGEESILLDKQSSKYLKKPLVSVKNFKEALKEIDDYKKTPRSTAAKTKREAKNKKSDSKDILQKIFLKEEDYFLENEYHARRLCDFHKKNSKEIIATLYAYNETRSKTELVLSFNEPVTIMDTQCQELVITDQEIFEELMTKSQNIKIAVTLLDYFSSEFAMINSELRDFLLQYSSSADLNRIKGSIIGINSRVIMDKIDEVPASDKIDAAYFSVTQRQYLKPVNDFIKKFFNSPSNIQQFVDNLIQLIEQNPDNKAENLETLQTFQKHFEDILNITEKDPDGYVIEIGSQAKNCIKENSEIMKNYIENLRALHPKEKISEVDDKIEHCKYPTKNSAKIYR